MPRPVRSPAPGPSLGTVALVVAVVSIAVLTYAVYRLVGALEWRADQQPIAGGVTTEGRVVEVHYDQGRRSSRSYRAVVEYADSAGVEHRITSKAGGLVPNVGDSVRVSYDPDDPARAHDLTTGRGRWKGPLVVSSIGVVAIVVGDVAAAAVLLRVRRRVRAA